MPDAPGLELIAQEINKGKGKAGTVLETAFEHDKATLIVDAFHVLWALRWLRDEPAQQYRFLASVHAADYLPREPRFEVMMHLVSLGVAGFGDTPKRLRVKFRIPGNDARMPDLSGVWKAMNWGEREVYDMFGIHFDGHPDLRRILMPDDWEGHPARKDYPVQIKMTPKVYEPMQLTPEQFAANLQANRDRAKRG